MKITIKIPSPNLLRAEPPELREVEAEECGVPGLAVNPQPGVRGDWALTHVRSGLAVAVFPGKVKARLAAKRVAGLADWTLSGEELKGKVTGVQIMDACAGLDPWMRMVQAPGHDPSDIAGRG